MHARSSLAFLSVITLAELGWAQASATFPVAEEPSTAGPTPQAEDDANAQPEGPAPAPAEGAEGAPPPPPEDHPSVESAAPAEPPVSKTSLPGNPYGSVGATAPPPTPFPSNPYQGIPTPTPSPSPSPDEAPDDPTNWSVGGGILWDNSDVFNGAWRSYANYSQRSSLVSSLLLERRLGPSFHLLLQPLGSYSKLNLDNGSSGIDDGSVEQLSLGVEGGLRWVGNPGGIVELGMSHLLHLTYRRLVSENALNVILPGLANAEFDQVIVGMSNSLIAERELIKRLWLRMGVGLVGFQHASQKTIEHIEVTNESGFESEEEERKENEFRLGLTPSFALQLRLAF